LILVGNRLLSAAELQPESFVFVLPTLNVPDIVAAMGAGGT
jgi:hypothetical protein